jgi:hypothetical protein
MEVVGSSKTLVTTKLHDVGSQKTTILVRNSSLYRIKQLEEGARREFLLQ